MLALKKIISSLLLSCFFSVLAYADASNGDLFAYIAANYPALFSGTPQIGATADYNYAYYPTTGNYIGTSNGNVYISGPAITGGAIKYYGALSNLMPAITQWQATGTLSLLTGLEGPQGRTGMYGLNGATGVAGPKGPAGANGTNGSSFVYNMTCGVGHNAACKVGAIGPGGGSIFFVDYNDQYAGFDYLEAAPADIVAVVWCDVNTSIPAVAGWSANAVGSGQANTTAMLGVCTTGAANQADVYFTATKSDWFLGSEGEMMLMYTNLRQAGVGGFDIINFYWSSTEFSSTDAWAQYFLYGYQGYFTKNLFTLPVRPVRAF